MRFIVILSALLFIPTAHSKTVCVESKVDAKYIPLMKVEPEMVDRRVDGVYVKICIEVASMQKRIEYAGGGVCGGNSECGSNFLVLDDFSLELTKLVPQGEGLKPWKVLIAGNDDYHRLTIAKDIATAESILKNRTENQRVIMSDNIPAVASDVIRFQLSRDTAIKTDPLKQFNENMLKNASSLQIDVRRFENTNVQMLRLKVQEQQQSVGFQKK